MINKKAKVVLVNWTPNPIETMCWCRIVMQKPIPDTVNEIRENPEKWLGMGMDEYVDNHLMKDGMPTFLEYVNLTFKFENVSRALQQQLTRHRIGFSYSIQSLRCVDLPNFADKGEYYNPYCEEDANTVDYKTQNYLRFAGSMEDIQKNYREALSNGMPTQNARGLLPMNIFSTVTFSCSLRALIGMVNKRLCLKTQGEFREVARMIVEEVKSKMDPRIGKWFGSPCDKNHYCMMKGENEEQLRLDKMTGKQNTDHVCPKFLKKFVKVKDNEN